MAELKYGGSDVKIMYGSQEIGGATKLEPGTVLYISNYKGDSFENVHLLNTTKNWSNINGINVKMHDNSNFETLYGDLNITGDDFKSLNEAKTYETGKNNLTVTVSRSIVDGEYRLNISVSPSSPYTKYIFEIKAI